MLLFLCRELGPTDKIEQGGRPRTESSGLSVWPVRGCTTRREFDSVWITAEPRPKGKSLTNAIIPLMASHLPVCHERPPSRLISIESRRVECKSTTESFRTHRIKLADAQSRSRMTRHSRTKPCTVWKKVVPEFAWQDRYPPVDRHCPVNSDTSSPRPSPRAQGRATRATSCPMPHARRDIRSQCGWHAQNEVTGVVFRSTPTVDKTCPWGSVVVAAAHHRIKIPAKQPQLKQDPDQDSKRRCCEPSRTLATSATRTCDR